RHGFRWLSDQPLMGKSVAGLGGSAGAGAGAAAAAAAIAGCSVCQTTGDDHKADTSGGAQTTGRTLRGVTAGTGSGVVLRDTHAGGEQQTTGQQGDCLFFHISTPQDGFFGIIPSSQLMGTLCYALVPISDD